MAPAPASTGPWQCRDLGVRLDEPNWIELPDGRIITADRLYDGGARTALFWLDVECARLRECLRLPPQRQHGTPA